MKTIIALALATTIIAGAPLVATQAFAVDTSISKLCGPDAPEAYKRAGGYCEQIGSNESQGTEKSKSDRPWWWFLV